MPDGRASEFPPLDRALRSEEYRRALELAEEYGLFRLDRRDWSRIFSHLGIEL